jgi:mucin-3/17
MPFNQTNSLPGMLPTATIALALALMPPSVLARPFNWVAFSDEHFYYVPWAVQGPAHRPHHRPYLQPSYTLTPVDLIGYTSKTSSSSTATLYNALVTVTASAIHPTSQLVGIAGSTNGVSIPTATPMSADSPGESASLTITQDSILTTSTYSLSDGLVLSTADPAMTVSAETASIASTGSDSHAASLSMIGSTSSKFKTAAANGTQTASKAVSLDYPLAGSIVTATATKLSSTSFNSAAVHAAQSTTRSTSTSAPSNASRFPGGTAISSSITRLSTIENAAQATGQISHSTTSSNQATISSGAAVSSNATSLNTTANSTQATGQTVDNTIVSNLSALQSTGQVLQNVSTTSDTTALPAESAVLSSLAGGSATSNPTQSAINSTDDTVTSSSDITLSSASNTSSSMPGSNTTLNAVEGAGKAASASASNLGLVIPTWPVAFASTTASPTAVNAAQVSGQSSSSSTAAAGKRSIALAENIDDAVVQPLEPRMPILSSELGDSLESEVDDTFPRPVVDEFDDHPYFSSHRRRRFGGPRRQHHDHVIVAWGTPEDRISWEE